jgi:formamidopyrimidine-DNA glycosylase
MPELPEVERARQTLEAVLGRRIARVDDRDTYVCRPHAPGEIADALVGEEFVSARRRGKFMWLETDDGPTLGLHLGMTGEIVIEGPGEKPHWDRFSIEFEDGTRVALRDRRRLGRAMLNPDFSHVGPDAAEVGREEFRRRMGVGRAPIKARLLDQAHISGIGNLLAAIRSAIRNGGAHTGRFIRERSPEGSCPRDGSPLSRATIGGRTTYWCPVCQT